MSGQRAFDVLVAVAEQCPDPFRLADAHHVTLDGQAGGTVALWRAVCWLRDHEYFGCVCRYGSDRRFWWELSDLAIERLAADGFDFVRRTRKAVAS